MEKVLKINDKLVVQEFSDGEALVFDNEREMTHILNETALVAYHMCPGRSIKEAEDSFVAHFASFPKLVRVTGEPGGEAEDEGLDEDEWDEEDLMENYDFELDREGIAETVSEEDLRKDFQSIVEALLEKEILV